MKFNTQYRKLTINIISLLFIVLFVYAAVSKLLDFETFTVQLAQSPLLSAYAGVIAWLVPGLEILIAFFLMVTRFRKPALYASFTLMVMFTAYIYIILNFSDFIPCSCGGVLEKLSWTQHLIFNIVFILLGGMAVFLSAQGNSKKTLLLLANFAIFGIGTVALLFAFSEKKMHRNNAFQRRYMPNPLIKIGEFDLKSTTHYIAGLTDDTIFLGNYSAPLYLKAIDRNLNGIRDFRVSISNTDLPYRRAIISIEPPYFYLGDGTVPILFRGNIKNWKAIPHSYKEVYFTQYSVADSLVIGFVTMSSITASNALGLLNKEGGAIGLKVDTKILGDIKTGKFETDGSLLWNDKNKKFIYLYYYKNVYKILNKNLVYEGEGKTIDTIRVPQLDIVHNTTKNEFKIGGKSVIVNRQSASYGDFLYIHSDRLGRFENDKVLNAASIIDVYNIGNHSYNFVSTPPTPY